MTPINVNILAWLHVWSMEVINSYITMIIVKLHILQMASSYIVIATCSRKHFKAQSESPCRNLNELEEQLAKLMNIQFDLAIQ